MSLLLRLPPGTPLRDALVAHGVEFPCGGKGRCGRCRVRLIEGEVADEAAASILSADQIAAGWRLACHAVALSDVRLDIGQWEAAILADGRTAAFTPRPGFAVAIDLGTTTLAAQLLDLETGAVSGVKTGLNPQALAGSDVMSRIQYALTREGLAHLRDLIRAELGRMACELAGGRAIETVAIAGNTAMMHLFCGHNPAPLSHAPFEPEHLGLETFRGREIGWRLAGDPAVHFLPCPGGFVGSDVLAGIAAVGVDRSEELSVLIDLGTNGEIVAGNRERLLCASTAAGPAFEGGRIGCGMRAATGAISEVEPADGAFRCHVIGGGPARGICGSGLVDAVAAGLDAGVIGPNGRMRTRLELTGALSLTQADIREVQLAKGAIAAGLRVLLRRLGAGPPDVRRVYLAGAFGNYINRASARRLGMIEFPEEIVEPAGNTSLFGVKMALFQGGDYSFKDLLARIEHVPLGSDEEFQDQFVSAMSFPAR